MLKGVKVKSPKLRGDEESGEDEAEINLKKPTPGIVATLIRVFPGISRTLIQLR